MSPTARVYRRRPSTRWVLLTLSMVLAIIATACSARTGSGTAFDQQFIDMMVPHHQGAVEMALTAQERAEHPEILEMADAIIAAQTDEIDQMQAWRLAWFGSEQ